MKDLFRLEMGLESWLIYQECNQWIVSGTLNLTYNPVKCLILVVDSHIQVKEAKLYHKAYNFSSPVVKLSLAYFTMFAFPGIVISAGKWDIIGRYRPVLKVNDNPSQSWSTCWELKRIFLTSLLPHYSGFTMMSCLSYNQRTCNTRSLLPWIVEAVDIYNLNRGKN